MTARWGDDRFAPMPTPTAEALAAVANLRKALAAIPLLSPMYAPGNEPTAADACRRVLDMVEEGIHMIDVFVRSTDPDRRR